MKLLSQAAPILAAAAFVLAPLSCERTKEAAPPAERKAEGPAPSSERSRGPLKIALLPIIDALPFYLAEEKGYFNEEKVEVEALPVASALERDQLLQAEEADGMIGEIAAAAIFNRREERLKVVMTIRKSYPDAPIFRILAPPGAAPGSPADLKNVPIAISENTIIAYLTQRLLEAEGLKGDEIVGLSVPAIPERYQLLTEGRIKAATLPDPLAQSAMARGAVNIIDDSSHPEFAVTILAFSADTLRERGDEVRGFLKAWQRAAADVNLMPQAYRAMILEKIRIPRNIAATFSIPPFPYGDVPTREQWDDIVAWLLEKKLIDSASPYGKSITDDFLPPGE